MPIFLLLLLHRKQGWKTVVHLVQFLVFPLLSPQKILSIQGAIHPGFSFREEFLGLGLVWDQIRQEKQRDHGQLGLDNGLNPKVLETLLFPRLP